MALNCGIMLRECIRHEPLAKVVLQSDHFNSFFHYVEMSTFDIASDAFATFKVPRVVLFFCNLALFNSIGFVTRVFFAGSPDETQGARGRLPRAALRCRESLFKWRVRNGCDGDVFFNANRQSPLFKLSIIIIII